MKHKPGIGETEAILLGLLLYVLLQQIMGGGGGGGGGARSTRSTNLALARLRPSPWVSKVSCPTFSYIRSWEEVEEASARIGSKQTLIGVVDPPLN